MATGVGINAAYFSDAAFRVEYLDQVAATPGFNAGTPPTAARASTMICSAAACGSNGPPGAPALVSARMVSGGASTVTVELQGRGAAAGASVDIWDGAGSDQPGGWFAATSLGSFSIPVDSTAGGTFTRTLTLPKGPHELAARQTVAGQTGAFSAALGFTAADPAAPPPPTVNVPTGGFVSGNGRLQVGGTAAPGATVAVTAGGTTTRFTAADNGTWTGIITLPSVGGFGLSIAQTVGGVISAPSATATVKVALPPLSVTAPVDGATVSGPLNVTGSGANPTLGSVIVGDGDGNAFFADRGTVTVATGGAFSGGAVALDYGRHVLNIFQRANGLDGAGVIRTVSVPPPVGALAITSPDPNPDTITIVETSLRVQGAGGLPRTGLPGTVIVYQGDIKRAEGRRADDGSFDIPVVLSGAGPTTLSVSQTASSLSGAGSAESATRSPVISVVVRPGAPAITQPTTGAVQPGLAVDVAGKAVPGATVELAIDGGAPVTLTASATGDFATRLPLTNGSHVLTAVQTLAGARSPVSPRTLITRGRRDPAQPHRRHARGAGDRR